jgi:hypothetical protein
MTFIIFKQEDVFQCVVQMGKKNLKENNKDKRNKIIICLNSQKRHKLKWKQQSEHNCNEEKINFL